MRKLDRYVVTQFILTFLFGLLAFAFIFILIDMIENLDDFIDQKVPTTIIMKYYVYFVPQILSLMVPVAMLLASLFTTGKLSTSNELTIMKSSGISLYRFMVPFVVVGFIVSVGMIVFDGWAEPKINALRLQLSREFLKKNLQRGARYNLYFQEEGNRIVAMDYFDEATATARRVTIQEFDATDLTKMTMRWDAESMLWNERSGEWTLRSVMKRKFSSDSTLPIRKREVMERFDSVLIGKLSVTPTNIKRMQQKPEEMELGDFRDYIERQRLAGSDISRLVVDYHGKIAFPFASFIVVLFGVPFASTKRRSGLSVQFGISLLICFVYLVCQKLSQVFGYNGDLQPVLAAWLPNMLFFLAGCFVIVHVKK